MLSQILHSSGRGPRMGWWYSGSHRDASTFESPSKSQLDALPSEPYWRGRFTESYGGGEPHESCWGKSPSGTHRTTWKQAPSANDAKSNWLAILRTYFLPSQRERTGWVGTTERWDRDGTTGRRWSENELGAGSAEMPIHHCGPRVKHN